MKKHRRVGLTVGFFFSLCFAALASASVPLKQMPLPHGRSRYLESPPYYFKLLEAVLLNSNYERAKLNDETGDIRNLLQSNGVVNLPSDQLYELDREARHILDPIFEKYFPGKLSRYNLVFLDSHSDPAVLFLGKGTSSIPTICIDRLLLDHFESEEEFIGVVLHEIGHVLRARFADDPWFDSALKRMPEEAVVDGFATRMLIELGRNPLGYSMVMERFLPKELTRYHTRSGFLSHPPTESRLTHVNALIERASERRSFPKLTPIKGVFKSIRAVPPMRYGFNHARFDVAMAATLGDAIKGLGSGWPSDREEFNRDVLGDLRVEFQTLLNQVNPTNLRAWQADKSWEGVAEGFRLFWQKAPKKTDPEVIKFFFEEEEILHQKAKSFGMNFYSTSERQVQLLTSLEKVDRVDELVSWASSIRLPPKGGGYEAPLRLAGDHIGYAVYENPEIFKQGFASYLRLVPQLFEWTQVAIKTGHIDNLNAIRKTRDLMTNSLFGWATLASTHTEVKKRGGYFKEWDSVIAKMKIPAYAKLVFCPPLMVTRDFGWTLNDRFDRVEGFAGKPLFPSSILFITTPAGDGLEFSKFHDGLKFIKALMGEEALGFEKAGETYHPGIPLPLFFDDQTNWFASALSRLTLTGQDAFDVLNDDSYWEKYVPRDREKARTALQKAADGVIDATDFFVGPVKRRYKKGVRRDVNETVDSFFDKNFYQRPEYQLDPKYAENIQAKIYQNLKRNNALPQNLTDEIKLWTRFAKRGVTSFSDEWANLIEQRFQNLPEKTPAETEAIKQMFFSNLVWNLKTREKLALHVYAKENSSAVAKIRDRKHVFSHSRGAEIKSLVDAVIHEFPENSQERVQVVDRIAERTRATREETTAMMKMIDHEERALKDLEITRKQALGIRFYSQMFAELQNSDFNSKLRLFDFLLGKNDYTPSVLKPREGYDAEKEEQRNEPFLYVVRRTLKPYRIRSAFQTLSLEAKTILLDPFFIGSNGIIESSRGRDWIIDTLVPKDASWRQMAVDLVDGYREALNRFGQGHLKTMFVSYLVASSSRSGSRTDYSSVFASDGASHSQETDVGKMLHSLFSANAALQKIGQRVHSSNILEPEINKSLESIKESASRVLREDQHAWLDNAGTCDDICRKIEIQEELGNASVKIILDAKIEGVDSVLYMIKPNALNRGEVFFQMIEYAIQYAIDKGHADLRLVQGMISRARKTLVRETNLDFEREAKVKLEASYQLGKTYGDGYQFTTPDFIDTNHLLKSDLAAAVRKIKVLRFFDLSDQEKVGFANAVTEKESEIHRFSKSPAGTVIFEKDRHEGNYLLVTDEALLRKLGITNGKLILVIDFSQVSEIKVATQNDILNAVAVIGSFQANLLKEEKTAELLTSLLNNSLLQANSQKVEVANVQRHLLQSAKLSTGLKPGELLSRLLSYIETDGNIIQDEVWDYLTAVSTMQTWDKYNEAHAFASSLKNDVMSRCAKLLMGGSL